MKKTNNGQLWDMVAELDAHAGSNYVTEWELGFIGDMHAYINKRSYTPSQQEHIIRLWEKYCV